MNNSLAATSALSHALGSALPPAVMGTVSPADTSPDLWNDDGSAKHWNDDLTPAVCPLTLKQCLAEMQAGIKDFQSAFDKSVTAALRIGHAALSAKELVPYGKFMEWLQANVTTMSGTWVRVCMRAAQVADLLEGRERRDAIIATAGTVEGVAALLPWLKEGHNPDATPVPSTLPKGKPRGNPPKLVIDRSPDAGKGEDGPSYEPSETIELQLKLDEREAKLDAREAALNAREKALDERERNLAMREAVRPADVADVTPRKPSSMDKQPEGETIDQIKARLAEKEAKRAIKAAAATKPTEKPAKKAPRKPAAAAVSADQAPVEATLPAAEKTAPTQPTGGAAPVPGDEEVM